MSRKLEFSQGPTKFDDTVRVREIILSNDTKILIAEHYYHFEIFHVSVSLGPGIEV